MALMKKTQRSFSGGQLDKDLTGRQDLNKYSQGCLTLENFKVRKQGNVIKRSGTDLVCDFSRIRGEASADDVVAAKLVPLVQERGNGLYVLLTGGRAYLVSPDGAKMNDGTWSRQPRHAASPSTLAPYSAEVPFADADLAMLDWCQSGDTLFFAHRSYPPGRLVYAGGSLAYSRIEFRQGTGNPPRISSVVQSGTGWNGTGGTVHLEYAVTAVKDGVETGMSVPYAVDYNAPWPTTGSYVITIDTSGMAADSWDCFYVYKKESDVFGLIGTTSRHTAFVDVSYGFSAGGTLYPAGFSSFDKTVHLRESGNKFASVSSVESSSYRTVISSLCQQAYPPHQSSYSELDLDMFRIWKQTKEGRAGTREQVGSVSTTCSATAQKSASDAETVVFTLGSQPSPTSFRIGVGSLRHHVSSVTETYVDEIWHYIPSHLRFTCYDTPSRTDSQSRTTSTKWTGEYTEFSACPAKWFKATVEYLNNGSWTTSAQFDCKAVVDQSNPGSEWTAAGTGKWRKTYSADDAMWSYVDAATVIARMDANQPAVGAAVEFDVPAAALGKKIRKVTLYGYAAQGSSTAAGLVVNGFSCRQSGAFVNTFTDRYVTPDLTITPPKTEDHFVNPGEYPGCVQLYSQRLVYAASADSPFTFWMSCTGDLYNFDAHEYVRASDAITASTAALEMPRINRMLVHRDLMLFAEGGEWQVAPSAGNAVAPSTISAKLQSTVGCAAWLKPIPVDSDIVFCDSSGETLMATRYNFASDGYESSNLSVLSQRLFRNNPIAAMAYAQFPESTIECVLSDGTVASLVFMKEHEVCAWSKHVLGGGWKAVDVAANKAVPNGSSHCAFVATRTMPSREWAVLALRDIDPNDFSLLGNLRMDAVRTVAVARTGGEPGEPPTPGQGETVVKVGETRTTEGGVTAVTADVYAVGCAFASVLKTTSPEFTDQETAQMEVKNATECEIRVIDGSDFTVRRDGVPPEKATQMRVPCPVDTSGETYSVAAGDADCKLPLVGTNTMNGSVIIEHDGVLPLAILSVSTAFRIEYSNHANGGSNNGRD